MKYSELIELTKNRIDELDVDEQIDLIIENAINHSYLFDLSSLDSRVSSSYIPVINGIATLPDDINKIISINPSLEYGERRVGNAILSNRNITFTVIYTTVPTPLINDTDTPDLSEKYHYSMSTYACYEYFMHRKKNTLAQMFYDTYQRELNKLKENDDVGEEVVYDVVGDK